MVKNIASLKQGVQAITHHLKTMPSCPGVYRMLDKGGNVLYVGKARNLAKRVINYTRPDPLPYRIKAMISYTQSIEVTTTSTESEALLLEATLIKKYEPRYNILLKDDKSFPYILITGNHLYPRICKHRGTRKSKGQYFGPFSSAGAVNHVINDLQKIFLLRPCTDNYFKNRSRPCMEYQIKRCSAPCVNHVSEEEYANYVDHAIQFLKGKTDQVQKHFITLMEQESQKLNYEKAAHYRDRIQALNHIQLQQEQHDKSLDDSDIITLATANDKSCINVVFYRGRQDFGNQFFYPKHTHDRSPSDILSAFIIQFYQNHTPPRHVYLSEPIEDMELVQDTLSDLASKRVSIAVPQKGNKRTLISKVLVNAHMALQQKLSSEMQHHTFLKALVPLFDLAETPKRIEVYDNSHISGKHEVGAMIVVDDEGFNKKAYRKFSIKDIQNNHGDDYAMMREVLTRRLKNLQKEAPQYQPHIWPDLLLIDGGVGQLSAVQEVLHTLKLEIPVVAIAKGPDRNAGREVFYFAHKSPLSLPPEDPVLYFLQRIRDEAHRFVIGAHRQKRKKALTQSALDDVPNIGTKRKKALLQFFGSVQEIKNASVEELSRVEGINASLAEDIYHYFR